MRQNCGIAVGGIGAAVLILSFVVSLEVQIATARPSFEPAPVNRTLKGDRQPMPRGPLSENPAQNPAQHPRLPDGCEAGFSSTKNIYRNEIAGRCVAMAPIEPAEFVKIG